MYFLDFAFKNDDFFFETVSLDTPNLIKLRCSGSRLRAPCSIFFQDEFMGRIFAPALRL